MISITIPPMPTAVLTVQAPSPVAMTIQAYGVRGDSDYYDGAYTVIPRAWEEVTLATSGKTMRDNVTVQEIPYYRTSNLYGGDTIFIGYQEVNNG